MRPGTGYLVGVAVLALAGSANAAEPESCKTVRFSDVGWTDITATTALASVVLEGLGYETRGRHPLGAGHLPEPEERRHRRLPRQLDADHGGRHRALQGGRQRRGGPRQPGGCQVHAGRAQVPRRRGPQGLRRHRQVQGPARRPDLRHRARQRRQPPDPEDDRRGPVRPRPASSWSRAPSRACWPRCERAVARQRRRSCSWAGSRTR